MESVLTLDTYRCQGVLLWGAPTCLARPFAGHLCGQRGIAQGSSTPTMTFTNGIAGLMTLIAAITSPVTLALATEHHANSSSVNSAP